MKVIRANSAGTCYGVQRALDIASDCLKQGGSAQTLGPLIHNARVVSRLEQQGIGVADTPSDIKADQIIIRSHGVTPEVLEEVKQSKAAVVDATCPHVLRAQKAAQKLAGEGKTVLIVGEADHPEVQGLKAWALSAGNKVAVVLNPHEIPEDIAEPLGVVAQTTQPAATLDAIVEVLVNKGLHPEVVNTICNATTMRQDAAKELAQNVDAMVVVGGKHSSNTKRLYEICAAICPKTVHIEDTNELAPEYFSGCETIGITAGASTPEDQIVAVEEYLDSMDASL